MKFIFPQNYNFNTKLFGVIDYKIALLNISIWIILFFILNLLINSLILKLIIFIIICLPIFLFTIIGFNNENIFNIFYYLIKYIKNNKIYLFIK